MSELAKSRNPSGEQLVEFKMEEPINLTPRNDKSTVNLH